MEHWYAVTAKKLACNHNLMVNTKTTTTEVSKWWMRGLWPIVAGIYCISSLQDCFFMEVSSNWGSRIRNPTGFHRFDPWTLSRTTPIYNLIIFVFFALWHTFKNLDLRFTMQRIFYELPGFRLARILLGLPCILAFKNNQNHPTCSSTKFYIWNRIRTIPVDDSLSDTQMIPENW